MYKHLCLVVWLGLFLTACQSQIIVTQSQITPLSQAAFVAAPKQEGTSVPKPAPHGTISEVKAFESHSIPNTKSLSFEIQYPFLANSQANDKFRTQAIKCVDIAYFKVSVSGIAMATPLYANGADAFDMVSSAGSCNLTETVANVPFGLARIGKVVAYDVSRNEIPGSTIQAVFDVTAHPTNVEISYRSTPNGKIVEGIIANPNPVIASHMNLTDLKTLIDSITGVAGDFPHYTYATHPALVNTGNLITDLLGNGGDSTLLNPTSLSYKTVAATVTGTIAGLVGNDQAFINVHDPSSPLLTNLYNGGFSRNTVTPGTWTVSANASGGTNYTVSAIPPAIVGAGGSINIGLITFTPLTPTISSLSLSTDQAGDTITINGSNFHANAQSNVVQFGAATVPTADITVVSASQLDVKVPYLASSIVGITVTVGSQTSNSMNFTVLPKITGVTPNFGYNTDTTNITINGGGFQSGATVNIGATAATGVTFVNASQLTATVPAAMTGGAYNVIVTNPDASSDTLVNGFTVKTPIYVNQAAVGANNGTSWANAYVSLQSALAAAVSGDDIWVAAGVYKPATVGSRGVSFQMKAGVGIYGGFNGTELNLASRNHVVNVTILSGDLSGNDVGLTNNTENSYHVVTGITGGTLDGFTIKGGNANAVSPDDRGAGISNIDSSPTLKNLVIEYNAAGQGAGIFNVGMGAGSSPVIQDVTISNNQTVAAPNTGAGMTTRDANSIPTLTNVTFSSNAAGSGGGLSVENGSDPILNTVTFSSNQALVANGGGMMVTGAGSNPQLTNVQFNNNIVPTQGGGMHVTTGVPTLNNVTFTGNQATTGATRAGGLFLSASNAILNNVTFTNNFSNQIGGGMYSSGGSSPVLTNVTFNGNNNAQSGGGLATNGLGIPVLNNVTFTGNSATSQGGGMHNAATSDPILSNVTFTNNTAPLGGGMYNSGSGDNPNMSNVTFTNNTATTNGGGMYNSGGADPLLNLVTFTGNTATTAGGGMYSTGASTGPILTNVTFTNNSAGTSGGGAYNGTSSIPSFTNVNFTSNTAGSSGGGMLNLAGALPTLNTVVFSGNTVTAAGSVGAGMFNAGAGTNPSLTNVQFNNNTSVSSGAGMHNATGSSATLTGVTFTGNNTTGAGSNGGGMLIASGAGASLTNVTFTNNSAVSEGGGIHNSSNTPTLINVTFKTNSAGSNGGGISSVATMPTLTGLLFDGNTATGDGGGMYSLGASASPTITNSIFINNSAFGGGGMKNTNTTSATLNRVVFYNNSAVGGIGVGGGMHSSGLTTSTLDNVLFANNSSVNAGGGLDLAGGTHTLTNVTISGNTANDSGGLRIETLTTVTLKNGIVWGNTAPTGPNINNLSLVGLTISDSDIEGGVGGLLGVITDGGNNLNTDPLFINMSDPDGVDNTFITADDGLLLQGTSPALHTGTATGAPAVDLLNIARPQGAGVDMGAYEQ